MTHPLKTALKDAGLLADRAFVAGRGGGPDGITRRCATKDETN